VTNAPTVPMVAKMLDAVSIQSLPKVWGPVSPEIVHELRPHRTVHCQRSSIASGSTQWASLDSLLGVGSPAIGRAMSTMENSYRTSLLLV
jgi:hypothetical protein